MLTTVGKLLVSEALPDEFKDIKEPMTKDNLDQILSIIAKKYPDRYRDISFKLMNLGGNAAFDEGVTLGLKDTQLPIDSRDFWLKHVAAQQRKIMATKASDAEKNSALAELYAVVHKHLVDETYDTSLAKNNPFALQVKSKARGNKLQLTQLMTTPGVFQDAEGHTIPVFIARSYAEGLKPHEYWAATYGARKSIISVKMATRDAGYLGKQLAAAATNLVVTNDDCGTRSGIPVNTDDTDNIGAVLARAAGPYKAGTVINKEILDSLKGNNIDEVIVRSPLTCGLAKGLCKHCIGLREGGKFPNIGDYIGITAASAVAERIAQGALNVKHSGGQASKKTDDDDQYAGFDLIEQFAQVPENFRSKATLAQVDGVVDRVETAPQGGTNVSVNGKIHYILPNLNTRVKVGDKLELGDQLSSGIIDPSELVKYKGIGEGRRYFTDRFTKLLRNSGFEAHRRNVEVLARAAMDHIIAGNATDSNTLPGEVINYNTYAYNYKPRPNTENKDVATAHGMYLEQPVLHYTIGARVDRAMTDKLKKHGITSVAVNKDPADFEPFMPGLRAESGYEPDWMAQLGSNYLQSNLLKNVHRGSDSNLKGLHPLPGVAKGIDFSLKEPIK